MDIEQKKQQIKEDIALQPQNLVFARTSICNEIQLANQLKSTLIPYFIGAANTLSTNTDTLHQVCVNLAKQRALLQGATATDVLYFNFTTASDYTSTGNLTFPVLEDSSYSNKTSFGYFVLHELTDDGGQVELSSVSDANTEIGGVKYFTDFSKYFLTRSRANGELISIDENTAPYASPTLAEPFFPANTINGQTYRGVATAPTANTDVRYDFRLTNDGTGHAGAGLDIVEDYYTGNTYVNLGLSNVNGTFQQDETLSDYSNNTTIIKSSQNTTTVFLELYNTSGTFQVDELLTDRTTNATIQSFSSVSNTEINVTLTGSSFVTGGNNSINLGFTTSETISLANNAISRTNNRVTVVSNNHGISSGERIILRGASEQYDEFNGTFVVNEVTQNTIVFTTSNTVSTKPQGDFTIQKNIVFGRTSNASAAVRQRTVNSTAVLLVQDGDMIANLQVGFPVSNTVQGRSTRASGKIDSRTIEGTWYQVRTNEEKTITDGTWNIDAAANTGNFWLQNLEPVKINQLVASTGSGGTYEIDKMVLDIALATSTDPSGGYDDTVRTQLPGIYFAYPLKTFEDQTHDGTVTLEAYQNFASVIVSPEGLEINFDWLPLGNNNDGSDLDPDGDVQTSAHNPEEATTINKTEFNTLLDVYGSSLPSDDVFTSSNPNTRSSAVKVGTLGAVYPNIDANPFFPAVAGTHKNNADSAGGITGTQPGPLTANDIYAGSYTEYQQGALGPPGDYRYRVYNDIKWTYGTNPLATHSSETGNYKTPKSDPFPEVYDGFTNYVGPTIDAITDEDAVVSSASVNSTTNTVPLDGTLICATSTDVGNTTTKYRYNTAVGIIESYEEECQPSGGEPPTYGGVVTSSSEYSCIFNRVRYLIASGPDAISITPTISGMESNFELLFNLAKAIQTSASYIDPIETAHTHYYSDSSFSSDVDTFIEAMEELITEYNDTRSRIISWDTAPVDHTAQFTISVGSALGTKLSDFKSALTTFKTNIGRRITEISNRIGYVNSKDVAVGGSTESPAKSRSGAKQGFQGYAFNGGNGYANTIYSHANFLAGKKLKTLEKILTAVDDVDQLYDQIKSKRSEYYDYNQ